MLQLKEKLEITSSEFMYILRNSVFEDAKVAGMEDISITDVKEGFTYYKNFKTYGGKETKVKTYVECYIEDVQYSATVASGSGSYAITYKVSEVSDGIEVEYTEADSYEKTLRKWNAGLMGFLLGKKNKGRVVSMLKSIEQFILENRADVNKKSRNMKTADAEIAAADTEE